MNVTVAMRGVVDGFAVANNWTAPLPEPDPGATVSHEASEVTVQEPLLPTKTKVDTADAVGTDHAAGTTLNAWPTTSTPGWVTEMVCVMTGLFDVEQISIAVRDTDEFALADNVSEALPEPLAGDTLSQP